MGPIESGICLLMGMCVCPIVLGYATINYQERKARTYTIEVLGKPRPYKNRQGRDKHIYSEKGNWHIQVLLQAKCNRPTIPLTGPVWVFMDFKMPRPKRLEKRAADMSGKIMWHTSVPDDDNLYKAARDQLKEAGWFRDDSQACMSVIRKRYCEVNEPAGVTIKMRELT